ncbi:MAG: PepSY domain-containing protein [Coprobacter sp.]|nr:PepSY domain-containing protein [Coprobacter sp.]
MRKIFRHIHLWLSVPFGLIITLICFSGAMLVFEAEIMKIFRHDLYYVKEVKEAPLPADKIMENVAGILPDDVMATGLNIFANPERSYQVSLSKPQRSSLFVDPYTGEVLGKYERSPFFLTMFKLHRWLLDSMKPGSDIFIGKLVVGISTLIFVFILISGIVIWWPRTRKALVNSLKISTGKGLKRFWYDLHVAGGMYILLFLLVMALTGLTWSFSWYRTGFYRLFGVEVQQRKSGKASSSPHGKEKNNENDGTKPAVSYAYWQQVYEELAKQNDGYKQITVSDGTATVAFGRLGNQRASDRYTFDPDNGTITSVDLYKDTEKSGKIRGWIYSVHVGNWGGTFTRILYFIAALGGASLPLTGYYLWIKRWTRKKHKV